MISELWFVISNLSRYCKDELIDQVLLQMLERKVCAVNLYWRVFGSSGHKYVGPMHLGLSNAY